MNKKYILLDDQSVEIGGTNLTTLSILEDRNNEIFTLAPSSLSLYDINDNKDKIWILGNITHLANNPDKNIIFELLKNTNFVKLEFDYNFCQYRGEIPHQKLGSQPCTCPHGLTGNKMLSDIYNLITTNAKHSFFMSERQRAIYANHMPLLNFSKTSILSSCFSKKNLENFNTLRANTKNKKYAILEGFGAWHSMAKGLEEAKNFCIVNNIEFDILPVQAYDQHIQLLSTYKGLVFLPIIDDTCPRCIIEARLLGLDVITNIHSQHVTEWWWKEPYLTEEYIKDRPKHFWNIIDSL